MKRAFGYVHQYTGMACCPGGQAIGCGEYDAA